MKLSILLAAIMTVVNLNVPGMIVFSIWAFTGLMCLKVDWIRNLMFGLYIVGGFWYFMAG